MECSLGLLEWKNKLSPAQARRGRRRLGGQSGVNYERENVGIEFEDDDMNDINSMKVVNENLK